MYFLSIEVVFMFMNKIETQPLFKETILKEHCLSENGLKQKQIETQKLCCSI